jgi:hypothetical protein
VTYHPFAGLVDSAQLERTAAALFRQMRLDTVTAPAVVLRAVDRRAADRTGVYTLRQYGVLLVRGADGAWRRPRAAAQRGAAADRQAAVAATPRRL